MVRRGDSVAGRRDDGGYTTALALFLCGMDDVADCAAGDQLPHALVSVIDKEFGDELDAPDGDGGRDVTCYEPRDDGRGGGS